jgi:hypothetical protein
MTPTKTQRQRSPEELAASLTPLHIAILSRLPDQGQVGGMAPLTRSAAFLAQEFQRTEGVNLTGAQMGGAIRSMQFQGLTVPVRSLAGTIIGWQRTPLAAQILRDREQS